MREQKLNVHFIDIKKENGDAFRVVDMQGEIEKEYCVFCFLAISHSALPRRSDGLGWLRTNWSGLPMPELLSIVAAQQLQSTRP